MAESFAFDQNQRRNFDSWLTSNDAADVTPDGLYRVLGVAPGTGNFKPREELQPGFLDKFLDAFGVQTDKVKELKTLTMKQKQLEPFVNEMLKLKAVDLIHRNAQLRAAPETVGEAPNIDATLGFGGGQGQPQPFPGSLGGPSASGAPQMNGLMPAPEMGLPPGASSVAAAAGPQISPLDNPAAQPLSDGGRFMTPDAMITAPLPTGPQPGVPGSPNPMNYGSGFDEQGRPLGPQPAPELPIQPIRAEPIADPMQRAPMPAPAPPRKLKDFERFQAAQMLHSQATGQLVPDQNGKLVPFHPEAQLLDAGQQGELASIYGGNAPSGNVKLPAAPLMQALKGKQEGKAQDVSQPVREYLKAKDLPQTPENIDLARQAVRDEKLSDEKASIEFKESLQAGSQEVRNFLYSKTGKAFLVKAKPEEVEQAIKDAADKDVSTSARKAMDSFNLGGLDGMEKEKMAGLQQILHVTDRLKNEFTPEERREFVGYFQLPVNRLSQIIQANPRFAKFDALVNREGIAAFETGGKALTAQEAAIIFGFLPNAKEWSPENFEAKLLEADDYGRSKIHTIVQIATTNRRDIGKKMEAAMPKQGASGPATIKGNEDYSKLPSGTLFIGPDGKTRRKP